MIGIIIAIFFVVVIFVVLPIFSSLWYWYDYRTPNKKTRKEEKIYRISYKNFINMYSICSKNWTNRNGKNHIYYSNYSEKINQEFYFNFFDYIRFKKFLKKEKERRYNEEKDKRMVKILECFQKDIDNYNKNNMEYLDEKVKNIFNEKRRF